MTTHIYDNLHPEDLAMLQALYSRSADSVVNHVKKVEETGSGKFMERYYVGYGHRSIGDCGNTTMFFEGVSILFAKAIQDNQLYRGQETSTRYLDFGSRVFYDPFTTEKSAFILENWRQFYVKYMPVVVEHLKRKFPLQFEASLQEEATWFRAINARAFDIMRGFLPAAATTQLSWTASLRDANDVLHDLLYHPLVEVQEQAWNTLVLLSQRYPNSISKFSRPFHYERNTAMLNDLDKYKMSEARLSAYAFDRVGQLWPNDFAFEFGITAGHSIRSATLSDDRAIAERMKHQPLPKRYAELGNFTFRFLLDYGSFRDLQRHRNGICRMPLLTAEHGFSAWYIEQLPEELHQVAEDFVNSQLSAIQEIDRNWDKFSHTGSFEAALQYLYPLGMRVPVELIYSLPEAVYVSELRSSATVHPTLRPIALAMGRAIQNEFPDFKLFLDESEGQFDIRRGNQTIIQVGDENFEPSKEQLDNVAQSIKEKK